MSEAKDVLKQIDTIKECIDSAKEQLRCDKNVAAFVTLQNIDYYINQAKSAVEFIEHPLFNEAVKYILEEGCPDLNECVCGYLCKDPVNNGYCELYCQNQKGGHMHSGCVSRFLQKRITDREREEIMKKFDKSND